MTLAQANIFADITPKAPSLKEKNDKLDFYPEFIKSSHNSTNEKSTTQLENGQSICTKHSTKEAIQVE